MIWMLHVFKKHLAQECMKLFAHLSSAALSFINPRGSRFHEPSFNSSLLEDFEADEWTPDLIIMTLCFYDLMDLEEPMKELLRTRHFFDRLNHIGIFSFNASLSAMGNDTCLGCTRGLLR